MIRWLKRDVLIIDVKTNWITEFPFLRSWEVEEYIGEERRQISSPRKAPSTKL